MCSLETPDVARDLQKASSVAKGAAGRNGRLRKLWGRTAWRGHLHSCSVACFCAVHMPHSRTQQP